ncbi:DUF1631 domain-containing protein [Chitinimonas sp. BJB300]|uniref:DUF1631 domain-containing protein n=1 Tax=Chitinimonas sp. BJB300 TaxID=1559339 RepID=UPI000C0CB86F|nr:DUF1631 domain-containing protein [Chitinimonas sp. BJB300]PHV13332.1 hypothetical protein CSQ89_00820 [Chitinimonas sp. BJB300]TSJ85248.1 DUF1631 domain-containing protein [Chitinimonas sp. BJB300]
MSAAETQFAQNNLPQTSGQVADTTRQSAMKTQHESLAMLSSCRDLAADLLSKSLSTILDRIEESLFELADKSLDRDSYNLYMQARGEAQDKRLEIEREFRRRFVEGFDLTVRADKANRAEAFGDFDADSLSLVGHHDYEEDMAVTSIASKLKNKLGDDLTALNFRIGHLMALPEGDRDDNPMSPQAIVEAFRSACQKIESDMNVRLLVLKQFEQLASENVPNVYQNLNRFLIDRDIVPVLPKAGFRRSPSQPRRGASAGGADGDMPAGGYAAQMGFGAGGFAQASGGMPAYTVGNESELIGSLQQLLAFNQAMQAGISGPQAGNAPAPATMALPPMMTTSVGQSFLDALNLLQIGKTEGALADKGELDEEALIAGTANVLHQLKTTSLANSLGHVDAMTIDIVAMLFDNLFDDRNIPPPLKSLIGRLQIPVLKVAMLDTKFFASKQHPTRLFLDALAHAALGWDESDGTEDKLYRKIAELVERIVLEFDENISLFDTSLTDLEAFLASEEQIAQAEAEAAAAELMAAEQADLAGRRTEQVLSQRLANAGDLPPLIHEFLDTQWRQVLQHAALQREVKPDAWMDAAQAMEDLIWSVTPKIGVEERIRLVNLLPNLLQRLERHAEEAGVDRALRQAFFAELVNCHAGAIKSGLKQASDMAAAAAAAAAASEMPITAPPPPVASQPVQVSEADLTDLPSRDIGPQVTGFEVEDASWDTGLDKYGDYDDVVANQLRRGAWVEFRQEDGTLNRAKLAWVSPMKSRYLFTNRQGQNSVEFTLLELVDLFKRGDASIIESVPSVERAVSDMIGMLQTQAV